jgi:hypothetical protein
VAIIPISYDDLAAAAGAGKNTPDAIFQDYTDVASIAAAAKLSLGEVYTVAVCGVKGDVTSGNFKTGYAAYQEITISE